MLLLPPAPQRSTPHKIIITLMKFVMKPLLPNPYREQAGTSEAAGAFTSPIHFCRFVYSNMHVHSRIQPAANSPPYLHTACWVPRGPPERLCPMARRFAAGNGAVTRVIVIQICLFALRNKLAIIFMIIIIIV